MLMAAITSEINEKKRVGLRTAPTRTFRSTLS